MLQMLFMTLQECLFFLGYVTGKSEFPQPLSRAEKAEHIRRMEQGEESARQELITHNLRLVSHIARKYQVPGYGQDDLISIGVIGLIKAVNSFKSAAGVEGLLGDGENGGRTSPVCAAGGVQSEGESEEGEGE